MREEVWASEGGNQIMKRVKPVYTSKESLMAHPIRVIASMIQEIMKD